MTMNLGLILKSSQVIGLVGTLYQNLKQNTLFVSSTYIIHGEAFVANS